MAKSTADEYEDASSSQERATRSERKIIKLRAELEEAVQAGKKELAKEAEVRKSKGRGTGGAAGVVEEESGRRGISAEDNRASGGGESGENTSESAELRTTDKSKMAAEKRLFEQEVEREVNRRMHALGDEPTMHAVILQAHLQSARGTETKT